MAWDGDVRSTRSGFIGMALRQSAPRRGQSSHFRPDTRANSFALDVNEGCASSSRLTSEQDIVGANRLSDGLELGANGASGTRVAVAEQHPLEGPAKKDSSR